jgi:CheY-like chemotaxis protein
MKSGSVLVVDDDHDTCRVLVKLIQQCGHRAICVESGQAALDHLTHTIPDLVVLDQMMPDMDGLTVLRAIRCDPRLQRLPVVMFSAVTDKTFQALTVHEGASDYWIKGTIDYSRLADRLAPYLHA